MKIQQFSVKKKMFKWEWEVIATENSTQYIMIGVSNTSDECITAIRESVNLHRDIWQLYSWHNHRETTTHS